MSPSDYDRLPMNDNGGDVSPISENPSEDSQETSIKHTSAHMDATIQPTAEARSSASEETMPWRNPAPFSDSHPSPDTPSTHNDSQVQDDSMNDTKYVKAGIFARTLSQSPAPTKTRTRTRTFSNTPKQRKRSTFSELKQSISGPFSPSTHDLDRQLRKKERPDSTARRYDHARQTHRLWRLSVGECFLTFVICGAYAGILVAFWKKDLIDRSGRHWFNALITAISLLLGINLAASLRSYAKLLRWLLLAQRYQPLEVFDLVLGCESLFNVIKLVVKGRNLRNPYLPSWTQVLAVLWLLVNLSITVFVGMIGLNYGLDVNPNWLSVTSGNVSIVDLPTFAKDSFYSSISQIQSYGERGFPASPIYSLEQSDQALGQYETADNGTTAYWFTDLNPTDFNQDAISSYFIMSTAYCTVHNVTAGGFGNMTWVTYRDEGNITTNRTFSTAAMPGPGGVLAFSKINSSCGIGCTNIDIFMSRSNSSSNTTVSEDGDTPAYMPIPLYYTCNNTFTPILYLNDDGSWGPSTLTNYQISNQLQALFAGSIGWNGDPTLSENSSWTYQSYPSTSEVSSGTFSPTLAYDGVPTGVDMADFISSFAMKGILAMDDQNTGIGYVNITGLTPIAAQYLDVTWKYTGALLAGIPIVHFLSLILVFLFANRAIIKDDSPLSIAKLYFSLLHDKGFADRGCMLKGDEIIEYMDNPKVVYSWTDQGKKRDPETGQMIAHVDIFELVDGDNDNGGGNENGTERQPTWKIVKNWNNKFKHDILYDGGVVRQRKKEDRERSREYLDAREYF